MSISITILSGKNLHYPYLTLYSNKNIKINMILIISVFSPNPSRCLRVSTVKAKKRGEGGSERANTFFLIFLVPEMRAPSINETTISYAMSFFLKLLCNVDAWLLDNERRARMYNCCTWGRDGRPWRAKDGVKDSSTAGTAATAMLSLLSAWSRCSQGLTFRR